MSEKEPEKKEEPEKEETPQPVNAVTVLLAAVGDPPVPLPDDAADIERAAANLKKAAALLKEAIDRDQSMVSITAARQVLDLLEGDLNPPAPEPPADAAPGSHGGSQQQGMRTTGSVPPKPAGATSSTSASGSSGVAPPVKKH